MPVVMLATIRLPVYDVDGRPFSARVLLDSGSSVSFISEKLVKGLKLVRRTCNVGLDTVGEGPVQAVKSCVHVRIGYTEYEIPLSLDCLILSRIVGVLPANRVDVPGELVNFSGKLADPDWNLPGIVDMLLGADIYHSIAKGKNITFGKITLINTLFGFAVSGPLGVSASSYALAHVSAHVSAHVTNQDDVLEKFWELEEVPTFREKCTKLGVMFNIQYKNEEEKFAEDCFLSTSTSDSEGRWTTTLPFFGDVGKLGNSMRLSYIRLLNLEKKLIDNPITYQKYRDFMQEFLSLNHMEKVPNDELTTAVHDSYYIPHHCVIKEESTTTKLRVVFDASAKTSTGVALNDILAAGPKLQDDLFMILIRFRWHRIAVCGDVAKMYRQVGLDSAGKDYHRLLWRDNVKDEIVVYRMTRVIYGVKSAGYSSVKALQMTAERYLDGDDQLEASTKLLISRSMNDFYVDDMLSGAKNNIEARLLINSICKCLQTGGFELRKMASSNPELINELPEKLRENVDAFILGDFDHTIKTLGIIWFPLQDDFKFKVTHLDSDPEPVVKKRRKRKSVRKFRKMGISDESISQISTFTKRQILSDIAKIFDPLGLLSPAVVTLKICMQDIWKSGLDWDELLPEILTEPYLKWRNSLVLLRELSIPRQVLLSYEKNVVTELHVFCDASEKAYGACVYVCQIEGNVGSCRLLTSKCKVAPLKQLTIPKLELSAAYLGAKLLKSVRHALRNSEVELNFYAWSDSTTVLHWLGSLPGRWQTFVSNRVALIQDIVPFKKWRHVPTEQNPADLASRGVAVQDLIKSDIWWNGPDFLRVVPHQIPVQPTDFDEHLVSIEEKKVVVHALYTLEKVKVEIGEDVPVSIFEIFHLEKWSNLHKLLNCVSLCQRIVDCALKRKQKFSRGDFVTSSERVIALQKLVFATQDVHYKVEKTVLNRGDQMPKSHCLGKLYPFLDDKTGIIRVGGRLQAISGVSDNMTYPAILPKNCDLSRLLAIKIHEETLHGGLQLCIGTLRRSFWVISSRQMFKELIRNCVKCYRFNSKPKHALMGDLPAERIMPSRPFAFAGLDFAGPLFTKIKGGKEKVYLAIFVCFATKAAHIEVVSRMTSIACIAALHRFVARRGVPIRLHTDNGTNLRGARTEIATISGMLNSRSGKVASEAQKLGMEWVFIPPGSPNFGGLWEAAVKSAKSHLKKVVGKQVLTFEELATLCCDVELMLNSRPLMPLTEDANDLEALTPFMLLTGTSGGSLPLLPFRALKTELLEKVEPKRRWTHVLNMAADFWKRWQTEYVTSLQQRSKNCVEIPNLEVGDLVLVTHENLAPLEWPLGRILKVFPGNDGQVRSVLIKTHKGQYLRPAYKARKLPISHGKVFNKPDPVSEGEVKKVEEIVSEPKEGKRRSTRLIRKRQDVGLTSEY